MGTQSFHLYKHNFLLESDWHVHTNYVDGSSSVYENVKKAKENGLKMIGITEHVRRDLTYNFEDLLNEINESKEEIDIDILVGVEAKVIDQYGTLDISDPLRDKVDFVMGSFHSWYKEENPTIEEYKSSLLNMINSKKADIWAHPLLFIKNYNLSISENDLTEILISLKNNDMVVEINLRHQLPSIIFLKRLIDNNISLVLGSDAHKANEIWNKEKPHFIDDHHWEILINKQKELIDGNKN